jgi:hypothetical protein
VDVVKGFVAKWSQFLMDLEVHHGLDRNSDAHIWLVHHLYLELINEDATLWMAGWNAHTFTRLPGHPRHTRLPSPTQLYGIGMLQHGIRSLDPLLNEDNITVADLEHYGVDWAAHGEVRTMQHHWRHNTVSDLDESQRNPNHWGEPRQFIEVRVPAPACFLTEEQVIELHNTLDQADLDCRSHNMDILSAVWACALAFCHNLA